MSHFEISKDVLSKTVGDEEVLVDLNSGTYFGLNPIGTHIWSLIKSGLTQEQIIENLCETYSVDPKEASTDLTQFLSLLKERNFLSEASQSAINP